MVEFAGVTVADSTRAPRVLETSHPPSYYIPREDVRMELLSPSDGLSWCESVDWSLSCKLYVRTSLGRRSLKVAQQGHLDLGELEESSDARLSQGEEIR
jgi:hypothetical protein